MTNRARRNFIEVESCQVAKHGQFVSGDVFLCQKIKEEDRVLAVLSDGLGSGVKASVLATLTATMALKYAAEFMDIKRSAETIISTLPICSVRKISYSTFTIVDVEAGGRTRIIEYENPPCVVLRGGTLVTLEKASIPLGQLGGRAVYYSEFQAQLGDRIAFFSDGISQAGMGEFRTPFGWGIEQVSAYLTGAVQDDSEVSARTMAKDLAARAEQMDGGEAKDDITCGVVYVREPRRLLVASGPPYFQVRDRELASMVAGFPGRKAICGGTTANIISRLLKREVRVKMGDIDPEIPPAAVMDGVDLITEGTLTLARVAAMLESGLPPETPKGNAAVELAWLLLNSDVISFVVGTRINQAHQDPHVPVELDLRRNIIKRITALLETKYVKETSIDYF
jgi:hypothetical protein